MTAPSCAGLALPCGCMICLFYERRLQEVTSPVWVARCKGQIGAVLAALQSERAGQATPYWLGDKISHVDIAVTCALRFLRDAHPGLIDPATHTALVELANKLEDMDVFQLISQPFIPPA